ncbi:hypothetical protein [Polyangium aurulentum]|uniref:hypothetical protein n=1 Tax=Polyangium aurulentum TaxID=2567896 RepID=UPI0010AE9148|nr:hypothetical protein [Polyangium aurulentum]UQA54682.1 hypothetical protein E8A73_025255 [Polyangium aurulentum]
MVDKQELASVLAVFARASFEISRTLDHLEEMLDAGDMSSAEKSRIRVALPSLRARRIECDADLVAFTAKGRALAPPNQETMRGIEAATAALASRAAASKEAGAILGAVTDLLSHIKGAMG